VKLVSKYNCLVAGVLAAQVMFFVFLGSWGGFFRNFSFLPFLVVLCVLKRNWSGLSICVLSGFLLDIFSFATFGSFLFKTSFFFFIAALWLEFFSGSPPSQRSSIPDSPTKKKISRYPATRFRKRVKKGKC